MKQINSAKEKNKALPRKNVKKKVTKKAKTKTKVKERIVYKDILVETPLPSLGKCIVCESLPNLKHTQHNDFIIKCYGCGLASDVSDHHYNTLYARLYFTIKKWNELTQHLIRKVPEEDKNE